MTITKAYLQQAKCTDLDILKIGLTKRSIPYEYITEKDLTRNRVVLNPSIFVAGYISFILQACRILKIDGLETNDYPTFLNPYIHRKIWSSTLKDVQKELEDGISSIFVKPKEKVKRFTGKVLESYDSFYTNGSSKHTKVWCSEPVTWLSEFRVFVLRGNILDIKNYSGNPDIHLDMKTVSEMVRLMTEHGSAVGYALDVGVLETGQTALVEYNDAYSLGSYGLDSDLYTDLLLTRWEEIVKFVRT